MQTIRLFLEAFGRSRWLLAVGTLLLAVEGVLGVVAVVSVAPVIDLFLSPDLGHASALTGRLAALMRTCQVPVSLGSVVVLFMSLQVLKNAFAILVRHVLVRIRFRVLRELLVGTFADLFSARWGFFAAHSQGAMLNLLSREMDTVGSALGLITLLCASLVQLAFYFLVPFVVSWRVAAVSLATAGVLAVPFLLMGRRYYQLGKAGTATASALSTVMHESLGLAKLILGFGQEQRRVDELARVFDAHRRVAHRFHTLQAATPLAYEPLGVLVLVVTVLAGRRFGVPLSELAVMLWALRNCMPLLGQFLTQKNGLAHFAPSYEHIQDLRRQAVALRQPSGAQRFDGFRDRIAVEAITFQYPGQTPVLTEVTMEIRKGSLVALVGESGAGKSTLSDLLMGFHPPAAGRITVDGVPLECLDIRSYRQRIGYVPQESVLFNQSIRDNLRWARPEATEAEIADACRRANAEEFIQRFPQGCDTVVGDRGVRLSGGQCQRLALARALLRRPELLILDEATSALDTESERLIQRALESAARDTTVLVIAHRLSTIVNADYVYVLSQGRMVEAGTYQALVERNGRFSRMTRMQGLEPTAAISTGAL